MAKAGDDPTGGRTTPAYETRHDSDGDRAVSETVIDAVATVASVDPTNADLGLYETVDLEALDALFEHRSREGDWRFEFTVDDRHVVVQADGHVAVYEET